MKTPKGSTLQKRQELRDNFAEKQKHPERIYRYVMRRLRFWKT